MKLGAYPYGFALPTLALFGLLVIVAGTYAIVRPVLTSFNVTAQTERLTIAITDRPPSRWILEDVNLVENDEQPGTTFTGSLALAWPVQVTVERIAFGDLRIRIKCQDPPSRQAASETACQSAGTLYSIIDERLRALEPVVDIHVTNLRERAEVGQTVLLVVTGDVTLGGVVGIQTQGSTNAVLRSGRVSMLGRSVFTRRVFEGGSVSLEAGDRFVVTEPDSGSPTLGFILVDERPALTAAYRIVGRKASVTRPGGGSYPVSTSLFARFLADTVFRVLAGLLMLGAAVSEVGAFLLEAWREHRRTRPSPTDGQRPASPPPDPVEATAMMSDVPAAPLDAPGPTPVPPLAVADPVASTEEPTRPKSERS